MILITEPILHLYFKLYLFIWCVCMYVHVEVRGQRVGISFCLPPCDKTHIVRFGGKHFYTTSHITGWAISLTIRKCLGSLLVIICNSSFRCDYKNNNSNDLGIFDRSFNCWVIQNLEMKSGLSVRFVWQVCGWERKQKLFLVEKCPRQL